MIDFDVFFSGIKEVLEKNIIKLIKDHNNQKQLKSELTTFINNNKDKIESLDINSEIDYQGLTNYIFTQLLSDVDSFLYGDITQRDNMKKTILAKTVNYSCAKTSTLVKAVEQFTEVLLNLIKTFKEREIEAKELLVKNKAMDEISTIASGSTQTLLKAIKDSKASSVNTNNIGEVEKHVENLQNEISKKHTLYPDYGYTIKDGKAYSSPRTLEAEKKYPTNYEIVGDVFIGNKPISEINSNLCNYSYRNQTPIIINVKKAIKRLGNVVDPIQREAQQLVGNNLICYPCEFPPAFPISISFNGEVVFEYIKIRTKRILDDGTYVVTNDEQDNASFSFQMLLNTTNKTTNFNIKVLKPYAKTLLAVDLFLKCFYEHQIIQITNLDNGDVFLHGKVNTDITGYSEEIQNNEINILEKVIAIEKYYNRQILIKKDMKNKDYNAIMFYGSIIQGENIEQIWLSCDIPAILSEQTKTKLEELKESASDITYIGVETFKLFSRKYKIPVTKTFKNAIVKEVDKVIKKTEVLEIGDPINFTILPSEKDSLCITQLYSHQIDDPF